MKFLISFKSKQNNVVLLKSLVRFLFNNIGNLCSTKFIFYRVDCYDIKGKQYLKTGDKYYAADIGLRYR